MKFLQIAVALFLFTITSCTKKSAYTIQGEVSNITKKELYLHKVTNNSREVVDTAKVDLNGKFSMEGPVEEMGLYQIGVDARKGIMLILEPGANIELDANFDNPISYTLKGNEGSEELEALNTLKVQSNNEKQPLVDEFRAEDNQQKKQELIQQIRTLEKGYLNQIAEQAKTFKNPLAAVVAISSLNPKEYKKDFLAVNKRLQTELPESDFAKQFSTLAEKLEAMKDPLPIGTVAPEIDLPNPEGESIKLSSLRGKYVLLDFWAGWCGPCRRENPNVVAAYNKYKDKGFVVYNVSLDNNKKKWTDAIAKDKLDWPYHVSDLKYWQSAAAKSYGVTSIPQNYLLDKEGKVIAYNLRGIALDKKLEELIK